VGDRARALEGLVSGSFWRDRSIFLTGHTGFKGGWLALWLARLGARVHGYALDPDTSPSLCDVAKVPTVLASDVRADLANLERLRSAMRAAGPEILLHLAAQPLVRESYRAPVRTFATNVMGTAHVLDVARDIPTLRAVVIVTTDKVYENHELGQAYRETDALGGHDPYSASKAAAEIVTASYRQSFFARSEARVATARAGNVIGGADWARDRLVPDCLQAFARGEPVTLRYPRATRPWQHVLEPLSGYMLLAERLAGPDGAAFASAWNFGPNRDDDATVLAVAQQTASIWGEGARVQVDAATDHPHEAGFLRLDTTRAREELRWAPRWSLQQALEHTVRWHRAWMAGDDMASWCARQIDAYEAAIAA
jgi:CDP-glucose 4,6-dehydratase